MSDSSAPAASAAPSRPNPLLFVLFILSGATGLIYELIWTRELIFVFGGTTHAISTVLVAFMGGLGLGSYVAGKLAHRMANPGRVYGLIEIAIGVYALAVPLLLGLADPLYRALYPHVAQTPWLLTGARFIVGAMVMLLPTTLMGATLPILVRYAATSSGEAGRWIGRLYGINTLGAVVGTLAAGFLLMPQLGLTATTRLAAGINIGIGIIAVLALRTDSTLPLTLPSPRVPGEGDERRAALTPRVRTLALVTFAASGFAAMVYQICWTRALILSIGSSTYSFTCILAAFILGLALGSLLIARHVDRLKNPALAIGAAQVLIGLSAVLITPVYGYLPLLVHTLVQSLRENYELLVVVQLLLVFVITLVPTLLLGALFPLFTRVLAEGRTDPAAATGRAYAINTLGTILGSFLAGFVMIRGEQVFDLGGTLIERSGIGAQRSIALAAALNAALGGLLIVCARRAGQPLSRTVAPAALGVVAVFALAALPGRWDEEYLNSGPFRADLDPHMAKEQFTIVYQGDGVDMTVSVGRSKTDTESLTLRVNGKPDASTGVGDMCTQLLQGHIPMLLHADPKRVCVIGLGSGMSLSACACHPEAELLDSIEISEEVITAHEYFAPFTNDALNKDPRVRNLRADGRNHLALTDELYDVVISEPSNPWIAGVANLFTQEFFRLVDRKLAPGGVYSMWLQGYSLSQANFQLIVRTLATVFPHITIWETSPNDYALIASREPFRVPLARLRERMARPALQTDLYRIGHADVARVLSRVLTFGDATLEWAGKSAGPIHTDDNALLEFSAREIFRGEDLKTFGSLLSRTQSPLGTMVEGDDARLAERLKHALDARRLRLSVDQSRRGGSPPMEVAKVVLEGLRLDPGNVELQQRLRDAAAAIEKTTLAGREAAMRDELLARIAALRPMTLGARTGEAPRDIAARLYARGVFDETARRRGWAIEDLSESWEIDPRADTGVALAVELLRAGRDDEAGTILARVAELGGR